jgi:hypothetical protein
MTAAAAETVQVPQHDRAPCQREGARTASDWDSILATHAAAVAAWRTRHDPSYAGGPMTACPTCGAAGRAADQRRARGEPPGYIDARPGRTHTLPERPTPRTTIEAVMIAVRERGLGALREPATVERLSRCDAAARAEINRRIDAIGAPQETAP